MSATKIGAGAIGGGIGGFATGLVVGAARGALQTVSTKSITMSRSAGFEDGAYVTRASVNVRVPGIATTALWGGVLAGATALFGWNPASWPVLGFFAGKLGLAGAAAGLVTGITARVATSVVGKSIGHGIGYGLAGAGLGGAGAALLSSKNR